MSGLRPSYVILFRLIKLLFFFIKNIYTFRKYIYTRYSNAQVFQNMSAHNVAGNAIANVTITDSALELHIGHDRIQTLVQAAYHNLCQSYNAHVRTQDEVLDTNWVRFAFDGECGRIVEVDGSSEKKLLGTFYFSSDKRDSISWPADVEAASTGSTIGATGADTAGATSILQLNRGEPAHKKLRADARTFAKQQRVLGGYEKMNRKSLPFKAFSAGRSVNACVPVTTINCLLSRGELPKQESIMALAPTDGGYTSVAVVNTYLRQHHQMEFVHMSELYRNPRAALQSGETLMLLLKLEYASSEDVFVQWNEPEITHHAVLKASGTGASGGFILNSTAGSKPVRFDSDDWSTTENALDVFNAVFPKVTSIELFVSCKSTTIAQCAVLKHHAYMFVGKLQACVHLNKRADCVLG
jgi:hypothetical protein